MYGVTKVDKNRGYCKKYRQTKKGQETRRKYRQSERGKEIQRTYEQKNKQKIYARMIIRSYIHKRKLTRDICAICGINDNIEAHHENYDEPLHIMWLCTEHHSGVAHAR